jgi:hypothetical protein
MWREYFCAGANRRYWWLSGLLMVVYVGAILFSTKFGRAVAAPMPRMALVLAPVPPVIGFVALEFARIRATDELRQRMELEAATSSLALGIPLLLALGLLDDAGFTHIGLLLATPLLLAIYVVAQLWAHWRYR